MTAQILLIEDNPELRQVTSFILKNADFTVIEAENGREGLRLAHETHPDLILLDIVLPDTDGRELCRHIKAEQTLTDCIVVLISGIRVCSEEQALGLEFGADGYITRPIPKREFIARIHAFLRIYDAKAAQRKALNSLQQAHNELEMRVTERTSELRESNTKLQAEIIEHHQAEECLKILLKEKEILLRELYHRTRNNMHVIRAMLSLQSEYKQHDKIRTTLENIQHRIDAMALVHEKLYRSHDLSRIHLREYIEDLTDLLRHSYNVPSSRISCVLDIEQDISVLLDIAIPCGLILNELISNACKHAFPHERPGEIYIRVRKEESGTLELEVSDNGVGMPEGFDFKSQTTLGLRTVAMIGEYQLQGHVEFEADQGVTCRIRFPDNLYRVRV